MEQETQMPNRHLQRCTTSQEISQCKSQPHEMPVQTHKVSKALYFYLRVGKGVYHGGPLEDDLA